MLGLVVLWGVSSQNVELAEGRNLAAQIGLNIRVLFAEEFDVDWRFTGEQINVFGQSEGNLPFLVHLAAEEVLANTLFTGLCVAHCSLSCRVRSR